MYAPLPNCKEGECYRQGWVVGVGGWGGLEIPKRGGVLKKGGMEN